MSHRRTIGVWPRACLLTVWLLSIPACVSPGQRAKLVEESQALGREVRRLERTVAKRDTTIALLRKQVEDLKGFGSDRPADLFVPVKVEIAGLSGGADYDGRPGDDGVTVHLRLRDADGDLVKAPGRVTVQLLDNTLMGAPRVLGLFKLVDPDELRRAWHGKFGTQHYTLKCPFPPGVRLPETGRVDVKVEFAGFLTGATLNALKEVSVSVPREAP